MTVWAQVVGSRYIRRAHGGENRFAAQLPVVRLMATTTGNAALFSRRGWELQQLAQDGSAGLMHSRANGYLDRFQIQAAGFPVILKNDTQESVYFARGFLPDRFGRFFSCGLKVSSTGRKRQSCSLTSTSSRLSCW